MSSEVTRARSEGALILAAAAVAGLVFLADILLPLGAAVCQLYVLPVVMGLWSLRHRFAWAAALAGSVLTVLGAAASPTGLQPWSAFVNRPLTLAVLWLSASLVLRYRTAQRRLQLAQEERRRSDLLLRRQEALAQLGQLAAVVAHEVRNPLAGIKGAIQVIGRRLPPEGQERAVIGDIVDRIDTLGALTEDLLLFARPRPPRPGPVELGPLLREAAGLLAADGRFGAVRIALHGEEPLVRADAAIMRDVFHNLLLNAAQALNGEGTIEVSIETQPERALVRVGDHGPGIPPELRGRAFEPFVTTRHRGTGLGLAIVKRQVEAHGGEVDLQCPPEGGTVVTVILPLAT